MNHQQQLLPAEQCIEALIRAGGNVYLAAERLFGADNKSAEAWLIASIAQDPMATETLHAQLRTLTVLKAFDALTKTLVMLPPVVTDLEPKDYVNFVTNLMKQVADLTAPRAASNPSFTPADALAKLMGALTPEARRAFLTLVSPPALDGPDGPNEGDSYDPGVRSGLGESLGFGAMERYESDDSAGSSDDVQRDLPDGSEGKAA